MNDCNIIYVAPHVGNIHVNERTVLFSFNVTWWMFLQMERERGREREREREREGEGVMIQE
jgi:hypothetical protein